MVGISMVLFSFAKGKGMGVKKEGKQRGVRKDFLSGTVECRKREA